MHISVAKNGESIIATKRGIIKLLTNVGISGMLEDVLYAPDVT